ncbi:MAG TPA: 16S rRNA (guanine(966)-N(2))-methyltransferase RsmD [Abditibacteriaceae bacterium]|jgi:16S rRNA (guanine(966)-N(2))-methyltransferase RsmD|nr:16S rRNA (guanine(966)-N(2))-methyltransferase RsmD [Abditibacteriaceae bacterium]
MRILGGEARGRTIKTREGNGTRPTDARARETLFNIVGARAVDARVLDLYAGSGSLGLEALSRGASSCLFIEQNAQACRAIGDNIRALKWEDRATIWQNSVKKALQRLVEKGERFDVIFADPPFDRAGELPELCALLDNSSPLLHNGKKPFCGLLVIQHHWKAEVGLSAAYSRVQERRAGESQLSFFELSQSDQSDDDQSDDDKSQIEYSNDAVSSTSPENIN